MNPFSNFTVRDEPFGLITKNNIQQIADTQFYSIAISQDKIIQDDRTVMGSYDGVKSRFFAANAKNNRAGKSNMSNDIDGIELASPQEFLAVAGKGKLCKAAGLTGVEKRACKKNIKNTCGRKPLFGRAKKEEWLKCAEGAVVTPEEAAKEAAEQLVPPSAERGAGLGTGATIMIGVAVVGFIALVGFALAGKRRSPATVQPAVA